MPVSWNQILAMKQWTTFSTGLKPQFSHRFSEVPVPKASGSQLQRLRSSGAPAPGGNGRGDCDRCGRALEAPGRVSAADPATGRSHFCWEKMGSLVEYTLAFLEETQVFMRWIMIHITLEFMFVSDASHLLDAGTRYSAQETVVWIRWNLEPMMWLHLIHVPLQILGLEHVGTISCSCQRPGEIS